MRIVARVLLTVALALTVSSASPRVASAALSPSASQLVQLINAYRSANGLGPLTVSPTITSAAQWMATSLATNDYFAHVSLDGRTMTQRMADAGYPAFATWTGEDLAAGYTDPPAVLNGWETSPAHNAVLLNGVYRAIGIGIAYDAASRYGWYWVADFGGVVDGVVALSTDSGYHAAWAQQSAFPTLAPGATTTLVIAYKNTGTRAWVRGQANLGTDQPQDVARPDLAYGWLSPDRPTTLSNGNADTVLPGELGWWQFTIRAPATPGTYRLAVRPVIDGITWLEEDGAYWDIVVR